MQRLALLKTLGDNTRYAIYLEIARSPSPRSTNQIAELLGLHANTVRPHLERMREVGLLDIEVDNRGVVGRPQNRYFVAPAAPSLGLEPPAFPLLAGMLATVVAQSQPPIAQIVEVGRTQGRAAVAASLARQGRPAGHGHAVHAANEGVRPTPARACVSSLVEELTNLGFDPVASDDGQETTIAFSHCPYRELAEIYPELVCQLHRGIVEGFVDGYDEEYGADPDTFTSTDFHTLADREPCQVSVGARYDPIPTSSIRPGETRSGWSSSTARPGWSNPRRTP